MRSKAERSTAASRLGFRIFGPKRAHRAGFFCAFGAKQALSLGGVGPGEGDDYPDDEQKKQQLDPDREPNQATRPSSPRTAALAVGGVRDQLGAAGVASGLGLLH